MTLTKIECALILVMCISGYKWDKIIRERVDKHKCYSEGAGNSVSECGVHEDLLCNGIYNNFFSNIDIFVVIL